MFGYAGKILKVYLSHGTTDVLETSDYSEMFLGGCGIAAKLHWDLVPGKVKAFDSENALIFATGPLAGVPVIGGSRWVVCGRSPVTSQEHFTYCNLGGDWGLRLKAAGFDAVVIQGNAPKPVFLFIRDGTVEIKDASYLSGKGAIDTREIIKTEFGADTGVAAIGPAGENRVVSAIILADDDASGTAGMGAVMGSKNLKAIAVKARHKKTKVANPEALDNLTRYFRYLDRKPVFGVTGIPLRITGPGTSKAPCYGCLGNCLRRNYKSETGQTGKFMCEAAIFYQFYAEARYGKGYEKPFQATKLCDQYGVNVAEIGTIIMWLLQCSGKGIVNDETIGIPISDVGSLEFLDNLVGKMARREGFGDLLAKGVDVAAESLGQEAVALLAPHLSKNRQRNVYDARLYINTALLHAMEPRLAMGQGQEITRIIFKWLEWRRGEAHSYMSNEVARRIAAHFWGSEIAADFSTHEGKALAAKMIQDRQTVRDCLILCGFIWPIMDSEFTEDHVVDPSLPAQILSAVTGKEFNEAALNRIGERVFTLRRAIYLREGHRGIEDDYLAESWHTVPATWDFPNPEMVVPGLGDEAVSRQGATVDRGLFEKMRSEYYYHRQWDPETGIPSVSKLRELGLAEIVESLGNYSSDSIVR
ncbi:MAG: hypothetical protein HQ553_06420 [Chloroflexi bacterium]|nr:hypothetical protein [Chloroflexota bacterium]